MSIQLLDADANAALSSSNQSLRQALYAGSICHIAASAASRRLVAAVVAVLKEEFGLSQADEAEALVAMRQLQFTLPAKDFYDRITKVRKTLESDAQLLEIVFSLVVEQGFERSANALDPARLRAVTHMGHENPLAAPAYSAHRDTWYANPQTQINWWMPLHDVTEGETFTFYPAYFDQALGNNSADFDYDRWMAQVGWQNTRGVKAAYPAPADGFDRSSALPFACKAGDVLLFSASHLHQTVNIVSAATRFSVDFRTVHLDDHASGIGAPNVDNRSTGCSLVDYKRD